MSRPTARTTSRSFLAICLLFASCALPLQAWAVDTDQDGLPDDWEQAKFNLDNTYKGSAVDEQVAPQ